MVLTGKQVKEIESSFKDEMMNKYRKQMEETGFWMEDVALLSYEESPKGLRCTFRVYPKPVAPLSNQLANEPFEVIKVI